MSLSGFGVRLRLEVQLGIRDENSWKSSRSFGLAQPDVRACHGDGGPQGGDEPAELGQ